MNSFDPFIKGQKPKAGLQEAYSLKKAISLDLPKEYLIELIILMDPMQIKVDSATDKIFFVAGVEIPPHLQPNAKDVLPQMKPKLEDANATWHSKGKDLSIYDMETRHLFFSIRLLYNGLCLQGKEMGDSKKLKTLRCTTPEALAKLQIMLNVISERDNITEQQIDDLAYMTGILNAFPPI